MIDIAPAIAALAPGLDPARRAEWVQALTAAMSGRRFDSAREIAMFLGQCSEETGGFTVTEESLDYTHPERLCAVYPREFPAVEVAKPYVGKPEMVGNFVYANRLGNGPTQSGDGFRFRGRGAVQVTGRNAYAACWRAIAPGTEFAAFPDLLAAPHGAAFSAVWWWLAHPPLIGLSDAWDVAGVTKIVNGGEVNLTARVRACATALAALAAAGGALNAEEPAKVAR